MIDSIFFSIPEILAFQFDSSSVLGLLGYHNSEVDFLQVFIWKL